MQIVQSIITAHSVRCQDWPTDEGKSMGGLTDGGACVACNREAISSTETLEDITEFDKGGSPSNGSSKTTHLHTVPCIE